MFLLGNNSWEMNRHQVFIAVLRRGRFLGCRLWLRLTHHTTTCATKMNSIHKVFHGIRWWIWSVSLNRFPDEYSFQWKTWYSCPNQPNLFLFNVSTIIWGPYSYFGHQIADRLMTSGHRNCRSSIANPLNLSTIILNVLLNPSLSRNLIPTSLISLASI